MDWAAHPLLILAAALCVVLALALVRVRAKPVFTEIDEALERVRQGEVGVRLEPGFSGRDARFVSRFNAALAEIEAGSYDWDRAAPAERAMFHALRKERPAQDGAGTTFVAVVEVDRFATLRQSIGYSLAN